MAKIGQKAMSRIIDNAIDQYVDQFIRLREQTNHDSAKLTILSRCPSEFRVAIESQINAMSGSVRKPVRVVTRAAKQIAPTIKVLLASTGDRDEFRDIRLPNKQAFEAQFHPQSDEDWCRIAYILSYVPSGHSPEDTQVTTNRSGRKVEQTPYHPPKVQDGDLIYLPNGRTFLILNRGRNFRQLTADQIEWYISWPQSQRATHPLMSGQ